MQNISYSKKKKKQTFEGKTAHQFVILDEHTNAKANQFYRPFYFKSYLACSVKAQQAF